MAKRKSDHVETPLKQHHQEAFTSKQDIYKRIKPLHIKFGFLDTEHLCKLPIKWLNHREVPDVTVEIVLNLYNASCTPTSFLLRNISIVGILRSMVLIAIFRFFMWPLSLINLGPQSIIHLQYLEMVSQKIEDNLLQAETDNIISFSSSDSIIKFKGEKIAAPHLKYK